MDKGIGHVVGSDIGILGVVLSATCNLEDVLRETVGCDANSTHEVVCVTSADLVPDATGTQGTLLCSVDLRIGGAKVLELLRILEVQVILKILEILDLDCFRQEIIKDRIAEVRYRFLQSLHTLADAVSFLRERPVLQIVVQ